MTETKLAKAQAWNRFVAALANAEKQWGAYCAVGVDPDTMRLPTTQRKAMTWYSKASSFEWFLEGFMRYYATHGGLQEMKLNLKPYEPIKKEDDDARS